jgi:hypothetical protein
MVQIPAGQIGIVIAQVGGPLPIGAKSAVYKPGFGDFRDVDAFVAAGGQKGVQRPVLPPGTVAPIHPVGFLVITRDAVFGSPVDEQQAKVAAKGGLRPQNFGLRADQLDVVRIQPRLREDGQVLDMIGIVTTLEGSPLPKGAIANRLGDFDDVAALEQRPETTDADLVEAARGRADMQTELARSSVGIDIARNRATGVAAEADGESYRLEKVGRAGAVHTEAEGLAIAKGLNAQQEAVGRDQTALINVIRELASGAQRFMPENLALNLGDAGLGGLTALVPLAMRRLSEGGPSGPAPQARLRGRRKDNGAAEETPPAPPLAPPRS